MDGLIVKFAQVLNNANSSLVDRTGLRSQPRKGSTPRTKNGSVSFDGAEPTNGLIIRTIIQPDLKNAPISTTTYKAAKYFLCGSVELAVPCDGLQYSANQRDTIMSPLLQPTDRNHSRTQMSRFPPPGTHFHTGPSGEYGGAWPGRSAGGWLSRRKSGRTGEPMESF